MRILREWLAAYRERTVAFMDFLDAYQERTRLMAMAPEERSREVSDVDVEPKHPTDPFQAWMSENYEVLSDVDIEEILWARGALQGTEPDGNEAEARSILTRHAVPGSAWK